MSVKDDLLAKLAAKQAERATVLAGKAALLEQVSAAEAELSELDAVIADLQAQIAALPPDPPTGPWDPRANVHSFADGWGLSGGPDLVERAKSFEARSGYRAATMLQFSGVNGFNGDFTGRVHMLTTLPHSALITQWGTSKSAPRGQAYTRATVLNDWAAMEQVANNQVKLDAFFTGMKKAITPAQQALCLERPDHENNGAFRWSYQIRANANINAADARALSIDGAHRYCAKFEAILWSAHRVMGQERYDSMRWIFNLAGGGTLYSTAQELAAIAWPKNVPPGTRLLLTHDDYCATPSDAKSAATITSVVDELVDSLPGVVGVGMDEMGGHCYRDLTAGQANEMKPIFRQWAQHQIARAQGYVDRGLWSHGNFFERVQPTRGSGMDSQVWANTLPIATRGQVIGADGKPFVSTYPILAEEWIKA